MEYSRMEELQGKIDTNLVEFRKIHSKLGELGLFEIASKLSDVFHNESYLKYSKGMEDCKQIFEK